LEKVAASYDPAQAKNKKQKTSAQRNKEKDHSNDEAPANLFKILPFHGDLDEIEFHPYATLPFIPTISNQLKRALNKAGCNAFCQIGKQTPEHPLKKKQDSSQPHERKKHS
jgi:hypothetical protein